MGISGTSILSTCHQYIKEYICCTNQQTIIVTSTSATICIIHPQHKPTDYDSVCCNANQDCRRSGVERIVRTMRAPLIGGLEYMGRIRILSCDIARCASSCDEQTNVNAPTLSPEQSPMSTEFNRTALHCHT